METRRLDEIQVPATRKRVLNERVVASLADSIKEIGLLNPITITRDGVLIAGLHRYKAVELLGEEEIAVQVLSAPKLLAELAEIDENLMRANLMGLERAEHVADRKRVYEALHPETRHGGSPKVTSDQPRTGETPSFVEDTATKSGRDRSTIAKDAKIGSMPESVRDAIRDTPVANNQSELLKLARLDETDQQAVADAVATGEYTGVEHAAIKLGIIEVDEPPEHEPREQPGTVVEAWCMAHDGSEYYPHAQATSTTVGDWEVFAFYSSEHRLSIEVYHVEDLEKWWLRAQEWLTEAKAEAEENEEECHENMIDAMFNAAPDESEIQQPSSTTSCASCSGRE